MLLELLQKAACWPKLRHFRSTSTENPTQVLVNSLKEFHRLSKTLETATLALPSVDSDTQTISTTETFDVPRVTHLVAKESQLSGMLVEETKYHPYYPDLRHLVLAVTSQIDSLHDPFDISILTFLSLHMLTDNEIQYIGIPFLVSPEDFVSLKCVKLTCVRHSFMAHFSPLVVRFASAFCKMCNRYKTSSEPPSATWLEQLFAP